MNDPKVKQVSNTVSPETTGLGTGLPNVDFDSIQKGLRPQVEVSVLEKTLRTARELATQLASGKGRILPSRNEFTWIEAA